MNRRAYLAAATAATAGRLGGCLEAALPGGESCPPYPGDGDGRTVCDGGGDASVFLRAEGETVSATGGELDFSLANDAGTDVSYAPCFWTVYEAAEDGWRRLRPIRGDAVGAFLPAGSERTLTLVVEAGETRDRRCAPYFVPGLDPGRHLFGVEGTAPDGVETLFLASFRATAEATST